MFEHFSFSKEQIKKYLKSALRDFNIAATSKIPEVSFRFCYDALLKLSIAICARNSLRVKARQGHHVELIRKLSEYLNDPEIEIIIGEMRAKRNWDLYGGGVLISQKETKDYVDWAKITIRKCKDYLKDFLS